MVVENLLGIFLTMDDFGLLSLRCPPEILFFLAYASRFWSLLVTVAPKILVLFACAEHILVFFGYGWVFSPYGRVFFLTVYPSSLQFSLPGSVCPKTWFSPSSLLLSPCDAIVFIVSVIFSCSGFVAGVFLSFLSRARRAPREPQRKFTRIHDKLYASVTTNALQTGSPEM